MPQFPIRPDSKSPINFATVSYTHLFDPARMQLSESLERYWTTVRCLPQELLRTLRITEETVRLRCV